MDTFQDIKQFLQDLNIINNKEQYIMIQRLQERIKKKKEQERLVEFLTHHYQKGDEEIVFRPNMQLIKQASQTVTSWKKGRFSQITQLFTNEQLENIRRQMQNTSLARQQENQIDNNRFQEYLNEILFKSDYAPTESYTENTEEIYK